MKTFTRDLIETLEIVESHEALRELGQDELRKVENALVLFERRNYEKMRSCKKPNKTYENYRKTDSRILNAKFAVKEEWHVRVEMGWVS